MKKLSLLLMAWLFAISLQAQADLELTATLNNANPLIYNDVTYTLTLTNKGPNPSGLVNVIAPRDLLTAGYGLVLTSATASVGTWNIFGQIWSVPNLAVNESATLTLVLFTMKPQLPDFQALVHSATRPDPDSEPNNYPSVGAPTEDDDVLISSNQNTCDLELTFVDTLCVESNGNYFVRFQIEAITADPAIDFVVVSQDQNFLNKTIIPSNEPAGTGFDNFFFNFTGSPVKYYAHPQGNPGCIVTKTLEMPLGCGSPTPPSPCIFPFFFPDQVFCVNGNSLGMVIDLFNDFQFGGSAAGLNLSDVYTVSIHDLLLDTDHNLGIGTIAQPFYFGLDGSFPIPQGDITIKVTRISDNACIGETFPFTASNFCLPPGGFFCPMSSIFPWHEWLKRVEFDGIDRTSGKSTLSDFRIWPASTGTESAFVNAGESVPISLTAGYSWVTYDEYVRIWIDTDRDGSLEDTEIVYDGILLAPPGAPNAEATLTGSMNIPADAVAGVTTMRIAMRRGAYPMNCESVPFGEVELYSVNILGGTGTSPNDCNQLTFELLGVTCDDTGTPDQPTDDRYFVDYLPTWPGHDGEIISGNAFKVVNGQFFFPPFLTGFQSTAIVGQTSQYGPISIADFPEISFSVRSFNFFPFCETPLATVTAPATCSNTTPPPPTPNCAVESNFPWEDWIREVKIPIQSFAASDGVAGGKSTYTDFSSGTPIILFPGSTIQMDITVGYSYFTYDEYIRGWIDKDNDGVFEASEIAFETIVTRPVDGTPSKTVGVNLSLATGESFLPTKLRLVMRRNAFAEPCGVIPYGEAEDYAVIVAASALQSGTRNAVAGFQRPKGISVFPNPAGEKTTLWLLDYLQKPLSISITDVQGKEIQRIEMAEISEPMLELPLHDLKNGVYFLRLNSDGMREKQLKLVKNYER